MEKFTTASFKWNYTVSLLGGEPVEKSLTKFCGIEKYIKLQEFEMKHYCRTFVSAKCISRKAYRLNLPF